MIEKITSVLIASLLAVFAIFGVANAQSDRDAYRTDNFSTSSGPAVDIRTSGGSVHVIGHGSNEVKVEMFVRQGGRYLSPSDTDLSDFEIIIEKSGDRVTASAEKLSRGWFGNNNISVSFRVYAPHASSVNGRTSGGSVTGENFNNQITLKTSGGSVTAKNLEGTAELSTSGGSVNLRDIHGLLNAKTSGGSITAENISGEATLRTSGGSIRLTDISARLSARTSGGSINADLASLSDDVELRTSGGSINIDLPGVTNFDVDLSGGRVHTQLRNFSGESKRNSIVGRMGEGGPLVKAKTSGGSVRLSYN